MSKRLSGSMKSRLYWFVDALFKGNLANPNWNYRYMDFNDVDGLREEFEEAISDPEVLKRVFTVWSNNIEIDNDGNVKNSTYASFRGFQCLRAHYDSRYPDELIDPPFEEWEETEYEFDSPNGGLVE